MSADTSRDVSLIKDEDVLRKMWQDTEDFGRKKEIRAHMYKLREARLREFYNTGEVSKEIQRTTTTETKSCDIPTHADSLADHSFLSLKSKEIRDSESPTRDVSYRITDKHNDNGWTVVTSNERSQDGKTHTTTKLASTSGSQKIDGGHLDYAAKNEQKASVYKDGDDKNYTKSVGAASNTIIQQEAVGGDENSSFKTSSTKTSSSSRVVTEHKSTSGDVVDNVRALPSSSQESTTNVQTRTYTTNIPNDLKNHPIYVEGKTKVTRETKTLADGTIVTTTKYETKSGNSTQTATSTQYEKKGSNTEQRSSSVKSSTQQTHSQISNRSVTDNRTDNTRAIEYVDNRRSTPESNVKIIRENVNRENDVRSTTKNVQSTNNEQVTRNVNVHVEKHTNIHNEVNDVNIRNQNITNDREIRHQVPATDETIYRTTKTKTITNREVPVESNETTHTTKTTTVTNKSYDTRDNKRIVNDEFINVERQHEKDTRDVTRTRTIEPSPERKQVKPKESSPERKPERYPKEPEQPYEPGERRQPIRPGKSELDQKPEPTEGQYDTTYRTDYTNRKISVEVSPTHDAFARSLRAVSPDRLSKCSSPSRSSVRSLRTSTNSLRSSTSPEKLRHPSRFSPERRSTSPRKSTDRFSSTETITYKSNRSSPDKKSPTKSPERTISNNVVTRKREDNYQNTTVSTTSTTRRDKKSPEPYNTDTITRRKKPTSSTVTDIDTSTVTRHTTRPRSRSPSSTSIASDIEYIRNIHDITTDLDEDVSVTTKRTTTNHVFENVTKDSRPTSLEIKTTKKTKKITDRSPTSPLTDIIGKKSPSDLPKEVPRKSSLKSPTKEPLSPSEKPPKYFSVSPTEPRPDRPLKRTDTYEERCRQILGITSDTTERRRSSTDKISTKRGSITKETIKSPVNDTPRRVSKSPEKSPSKLNEFPSQTRKSPQKEPLPKYPDRKSPTKDKPSVQEFPSQIRRSPNKEPLEKYPERKSPTKDKPSVQEFPSQIRKSPTKEPLEPYPGKKSPTKDKPSVQEFPSQIRKSPTKEPLERYTVKKSPTKDSPSVSEFPSQIRRSPEKEPLQKYPERSSPSKTVPSVSEFPSQIRRSPEKEPLPDYPQKSRPTSTAPSVAEFPSQIRRSPEKELLPKYPEKASPSKTAPTVCEFPSQIRRSPEREPLPKYPENSTPSKTSPSICEFPSQIRKSPEREPLPTYPEKTKPSKTAPTICEFPSQIRKSPEKEPLPKYPEKSNPTKTGPSISEFPSQIRKSPERSSPNRDTVSISEIPLLTRSSPERDYVTTQKITTQVNGYTTDLKPKKLKPKKDKPTSSSESETDDEPEIEETTTVTKIRELESRVPVDEPLVTKKFISALCREDEVERTDTIKKDTQTLLEEEILASEDTTRVNKTVKKDTVNKRNNEEFIQNERSPKGKSPTKKPTTDSKTEKQFETVTTTTTTRTVNNKNTPREKSPKKPETTTKVTSKFTGETEYTDEYRKQTKPVNKKIKTTEKITLYDVENLSDTEVDNSIHIRTHRIDDTKKTTKHLINGDVPRKGKPTDSPVRTKITDDKKPASTVPKKPTTTQTKPVGKSSPTGQYKVPSDKTTKTIDETRTKTTNIRKTVVQNVDLRSKTNNKPVDQVPKRHVVSTTITVTPKVKPSSTKPTNKTITKTTTTTTRISKLSQPKGKQPKLQNGHVSSDTDDESVVDSLEGSFVDTKTIKNEKVMRKTDKITRTTSDQLFKAPHKPPQRGLSKPELISPTKSRPESIPPKQIKKLEKKCISTKSIIINNNAEKEIIVDLQRSKSSREPTPDRVCPLPVSSEDDSGTPRYPDQVTEPDDGSLRRKPKKLSDIPIMESERTTNFTRITDITDNKKITEIDRVEETDDSLLTVNKKISKFLETADNLKKPLRPKSPAPKVHRPDFEVDETLKSDECLLSVSDKVSKFITTAEQLTTPQNIPNRPKSPKCQNYTDDEETEENTVNVSEKVSHFITTAQNVYKPKKPSEGPTPKVQRPDLTYVDESIKDDECLLSVSDKVSKFITTADKLTTTDTKKAVSLAKIDIKPKRESPTRYTPDCVQTKTEEEVYIRRSSKSPEKQLSPTRSPSPRQVNGDKTPTRRPSNQYSSINRNESPDNRYPRRDSSPKLSDTTPKSTRRPSHEESKIILSETNRLRSTESIKRAKALFENINKDQSSPKQRDILSRPSVFEGRKLKKPEETSKFTTPYKPDLTSRKLTYSDNEEETTIRTKTTRRPSSPDKDDYLKSTRLVMNNKPRERSKSPEKVPEITTTRPFSRESTPDYGDLPGYMRPLDRSLRPNSPHRDNLVKKPAPTAPVDEDVRTTKFGVTLRRTDSGRAITTNTTTTSSTTTSTERRKSSITLEKRVTEEEIEEIFDLEVLEELLEKVVGYELRRKIRTQIRLVKKLISENKLTTYITKKTTTVSNPSRREGSPVKTKPYKPNETIPKTTTDVRKVTEYQSKFTRKPSPERKVVNNKIFSHTDITDKKDRTEKVTEYQTSYSFNERRTSSDYSKTVRRSQSPETKVQRAKSPEKTKPTPEIKSTTTTTKTFTTLKKTVPISKTVLTEEKPEWVKQRNLKKTTDKTSSVKKTTTSSATTTKTSRRSSSPGKERKPTDLITSSYGVGPTDENGTPLFGLRALRAQNKTDTTKVQGTVIRSQYYSENGNEPVGQISVTKYSTDPRDLGSDEEIVNNKGITSVTTTQKFGYRDTPSLRSLNEKKKAICDIEDETLTSTTTKTTSKLNRRGSVKAISQKFIDNAVETLKSEKQSSYPKAGLILRTSSFKDSNSGDSREGSPTDDRLESTVTVKTTSTRTVGGETFLTNKSRVSGVQDVLSRMKAEDVSEVGDTEEDVRARGLLNKFLGSQVILSGMENRTTSKTSTTSTSSPTSTVRRSTKVTTTVTEGGKPTTKTRVFQRPVTEEELETVWDEQTLRLLLEQSTDYEERRLIRARLRQVMAEQEACTQLVEKASQEQSGGAIEEKVETTKKTVTTGPVTTTQVTTRVTSQQQMSKKPISPFAKFRQLDKQNSLNTPPSTPKTPSGSGPLFKFTDPALSQSASTIKDRLLYWCKMKTKEYENIQLDNFSTSWADGLAFCALIHHFLPDAFDYHALTPKERRHNFTLAFRVADEKADIAPLLDVDDMVATRKPDWKCVFTYVQSIYRRFKDED